jgi:hypothetical protein
MFEGARVGQEAKVSLSDRLSLNFSATSPFNRVESNNYAPGKPPEDSPTIEVLCCSKICLRMCNVAGCRKKFPANFIKSSFKAKLFAQLGRPSWPHHKWSMKFAQY